MSLRRSLLALGLALAAAGLGLGVARVVAHERGELEHREGSLHIDALRRSDPHATAQTVRLAEVDLARGDRVLAELCAASRAPAPAWEGTLHVVAWIPDGETLLFRTPLGAARERQRGGRRCWTVGIFTMRRSGRVAFEAFWPGAAPQPEVARATLELRVAAYALPTRTDRAAVGLLGLGVLLVAAGLGGRRRTAAPSSLAAAGEDDAPPSAATAAAPRPPGLPTALVACLLFALATVLAGLVSGGATGLLASGVTLALAQVGIAVVLARRSGLDALGLGPSGGPGRGAAHLAGALGVAVASTAVALWVPSLWPARGVAPLEAAIAWPSGKLAVGLVALVVPAAEEVFFRGLVFAALRPRLGPAGAVVGSSLLFLAAHVPQDLGNPGALVAVGLTGFLLGTLRAATGRLWAPVLAHVLYDAALVAAAWI